MKKLKKEIGNRFRNECYKRDSFSCRICGFKPLKNIPIEEQLNVHHITDRSEMSFGGYIVENGITLCHICHKKAEVFHQSGKTRWEEGFHPDDLYKLIGSSKEKAILASQNSVKRDQNPSIE